LAFGQVGEKIKAKTEIDIYLAFNYKTTKNMHDYLNKVSVR